MTPGLNEFYDGSELLPRVREFLSIYREAAGCGAEKLTEWLHDSGFAPRHVELYEVEAVLEVLAVEGEVQP